MTSSKEEEIIERMREMQGKEIRQSKYNSKSNIVELMKKLERNDVKVIAKFRCGNEDRKNGDGGVLGRNRR